VADSRQFGNPKVLQFGDRTAKSGDGHCAECEAMLADALDGTLSPAGQELFDTHMAACGPCSQLLADARRGAAFLELLRTPAPEPPAALLERILAQTSGAGSAQPLGFPIPAPQPGHIGPGHFGVAALTPAHAVPGAVLPFPRRAAAAFRASSFGQIMLQPRLAMTAAMAFFSIALTMNLTGVHLEDLRASDLKPSSLRRDVANANASVVRYYEGLRVVYELESRVHDLESAQDNDTVPAISQGAPAGASQSGNPAPPVSSRQPARQKAAPQPSNSQPDNNQPGSSGQPARKQVAPAPYISRGEALRQSRLLVAEQHHQLPHRFVPAQAERKLA
jgi:hypothetical protein